MADSAQYLTLGLGPETFGIDIRGVREILDMQPVTRLPQAPDFLLGLIDVRGASFPVVDLRTKLGLASVEPTNATRIIIVDVPMSGRNVGVGFVADCVFEVAQLDPGGDEPPPEVGGQWQSRYISLIGRKEGAFVIVFDLERLMENDDPAALRGAVMQIAA